MTGKSKNTRCFKRVKSLPVGYSENKKALMTSDLFEAKMGHWDWEIRLQNREILLLVNNCPAHPVLENLVILPANITSMLQFMDQGVRKSLKYHYRKLMLLRKIDDPKRSKIMQ